MKLAKLDAMNLETAAAELSWKNFRMKQVQHARETELVTSWDAITTLAKNDRDFLNEHVPFDILQEEKKETSSDKTAVKWLLTAANGESIETVLLLHTGGKKKWGTVCVSSQIGCAMACQFCATGQMKLTRNLTTDEILDQFLIAKREAAKRGIVGNLNVVFMGMGEPCLNLPAVIPTIKTLTDPNRHGLAASRITVSSSGIVPGMADLRAAALGISFALSLHAPNDQLRTRLMPINKQFPLAEVLAEIKKWQHGGAEVLIEYILIAGVNDQPEHAHELIEILHGQRVKVNLIPLNPIPDTDLQRPARDAMMHFLYELESAGMRAMLRHTKGDDIAAACGQLKTKSA